MSVWEKLQLKNQNPVLVINKPDDFEEILSNCPSELKFSARGKFDFVLVFGITLNDSAKFFPKAINSSSDDSIIWAAYPKKSSKKYNSEINRDYGWKEFGDNGFEGVRMVSINEDWTALRFKKVENIKNIKRNFAISDEGKKRINENG